MRVAAVVPSLNPDEKFTDVVTGLIDAGFNRVYVVNDGSSEEYTPLFNEAAAHPQVTLLRHQVNQGKGRALKTAFEAFLADPDDYVGLVTLDGDGQHSPQDTARIALALEENPDSLVLGVRDFSQSHVPKKSELGNKITRTVFRIACGLPITDTQTGLRGIPKAFAKALLEVQGERYEFETNMLLETKRHGVSYMEVPITTIYIDNNSASHFRPLWDSMRIYLLILKFMLSSASSALVDFAVFALLNGLVLTALPSQWRLLGATVGARVISATFNFIMNQRLVFASQTGTGGAFLRYALLCVVQMMASYGGIYLLSEVLPLHALVAKILVDGTLFFISFFIQRKWVFRSET